MTRFALLLTVFIALLALLEETMRSGNGENTPQGVETRSVNWNRLPPTVQWLKVDYDNDSGEVRALGRATWAG